MAASFHAPTIEPKTWRSHEKKTKKAQEGSQIAPQFGAVDLTIKQTMRQ
jgi:hypothetical protein